MIAVKIISKAIKNVNEVMKIPVPTTLTVTTKIPIWDVIRELMSPDKQNGRASRDEAI